MPRYMTIRAASLAATLATASLMTGGCAGITGIDVQPPPAHEFGFGPRVSAAGIYEARVEPMEPIVIGRMHGWRLQLHDRADAGVTGATITVDGGMPQHGHGLPTRPQVTRDHGDGRYDVEGMRFNMGGWWVVTFRIASPAGADSVTFNLSL